MIAVAALNAYLYRDVLAARVPSARPALQAYGETVDRLRDHLEERLGQFRRGKGTGTQG